MDVQVLREGAVEWKSCGPYEGDDVPYGRAVVSYGGVAVPMKGVLVLIKGTVITTKVVVPMKMGTTSVTQQCDHLGKGCGLHIFNANKYTMNTERFGLLVRTCAPFSASIVCSERTIPSIKCHKNITPCMFHDR